MKKGTILYQISKAIEHTAITTCKCMGEVPCDDCECIKVDLKEYGTEEAMLCGDHYESFRHAYFLTKDAAVKYHNDKLEMHLKKLRDLYYID